MSGQPFDPRDPDHQQRIDDRWTSQKLADAGWVFQNEKVCRLCGEDLAVYEKLGPPRRYLFLDNVTLEPHQC